MIKWMRQAQRQVAQSAGVPEKEHYPCLWCNSDTQHLHTVNRVIGGAMTGAVAVHCQGCDAYGPSGKTAQIAWAYWDGTEVPPCIL